MSNLKTNLTSLEALVDKANALPEAKTIQDSKTVTPTTSSQTVKPDSGYDGMGQVVVNAMPTGIMGPTEVTVSNSGLITAQPYVDSQGYITQDKMKTGTKQLTIQAAKTITPTKSSQTAVASGRYTTGTVTVAAIPDQYQDVSATTATPAHVASGDVFVDADGIEQTGKLDVTNVMLSNADNSHIVTGGYINTLMSSPVIEVYEPDLGDATRAQVLNGAVFSSKNYIYQTGTMPNNGDTSQTIDGLETQSVSVPAGYTTGGTIALDSTINDTADAQATIISEIATLLEGKSVPGGSGGSGDIETCTVSFDMTGTPFFTFVAYSTVENGSIVHSVLESEPINSTVLEVVKGTMVVFQSSTSWQSSSATNATILYDSSSTCVASIGTENTAIITLIKTSGPEK